MAGNGLSERLQFPISTAELNRRWAAVRAAMKREGVDVLLMQNNNDHMGGYVKYFTDMPATNGYPNTVVFPADDEMTVVCQGPFNGDSRPPADLWRGVKRLLTTPSYESAHFTQYYDPELAAKALAPFAKAHHRFRRHLSDVVCDGRLHHEEVSQREVSSTPASWSTASR